MPISKKTVDATRFINLISQLSATRDETLALSETMDAQVVKAVLLPQIDALTSMIETLESVLP